MKKSYLSVCCNPFRKDKHTNVKVGLRVVTQKVLEEFKHMGLSAGSKICDSCRKQISVQSLPMPSSSEEDEKMVASTSHSCNDSSLLVQKEVHVQHEVAVETFNASLASHLDVSPIVKKKLKQERYPEQKYRSVKKALKRSLFSPKLMEVSSDSDTPASDGHEIDSEIVNQLKEKFCQTTDRSVKLQLLTCLPKSWSIKQVERVFGAPNYMVRKAKQLVREKGIMSTPNPKPGKVLSAFTVDNIKAYYQSDDISRAMPGKKDFVSVKEGGSRVHKQKRLILSNLKEIYSSFKEKFPQHDVGFSKFAELRPKNCVLPGASGTHSVCVCTIHQNVKLMIIGAKLQELSADDGGQALKTYHDFLSEIVCNPPLPNCFLKECDSCPGTDTLKDRLVNLFDRNFIENVTFKQWVSVDRCTLETINMDTDDFLDSFVEKLQGLLRHSFIATQQSAFQSELKLTLEPGQFLVICDFAENYSFVLQDEAQGFHWNNSSATLHPFVAYYVEDGDLKHVSYVIISECLQHNTVAVHLFLRKMICFLTEKFGQLPKLIHYFSDGAASQYKNRKNFINLCYHKEDFGGVEAIWHFSATSHGKGACDGVGGMVKRLAARASLQRPYDSQIMTPRQLFDWATENIQAVSFNYCTNKEHDEEDKLLEARFSMSRPIAGTQKIHYMKPLSKTKVLTKVYSSSLTSKEESVCALENELEFEDIKGFVTCVYNGFWYPACVLETNSEKSLVKLSFFKEHGPSPSFTYPSPADILSVNANSILTTIDPQTRTGRVYTLTAKETENANEKLKVYNSKN